MNSGISDSDSGQNTKMAGLSQNQCPVYRGMTVRVMPESVSGLLRNMQSQLYYWRNKHRLQQSSTEREQSLADENARLKRLLAEQTEELAIVKKAAAYFAKHLK